MGAPTRDDNQWTVAELRERLDGYGDHVPVAIVIERNGRSIVATDFDVVDGHGEAGYDGEMHVELRSYE